MIKTQISGRMVSGGISDIAITSVHRENPSEEVDYDNYYYCSKLNKEMYVWMTKCFSKKYGNKG